MCYAQKKAALKAAFRVYSRGYFSSTILRTAWNSPACSAAK